MVRIALVRIEQAAEQLKKEKAKVTCSTLAEILGVKRIDVAHYLDGITGLREKIGVAKSDRKSATQARYAAAAERLREKNLPVSIQSIAKESNRNVTGVNAWFGRNPDAMTEIGVLPQVEANRLMRGGRKRAYTKRRQSTAQ